MIIVCMSGPKGCGKTTYTKKISDYFGRRNQRVCTIKADRISISFVIVYSLSWIKRIFLGKGKHFKEFYKDDVKRNTIGEKNNNNVLRQPLKFKDIQRIITYLLNAIVFRIYAIVMSFKYDVMICDRYSYDYIVRMARPESLYSKLIHSIYPFPLLSFYLQIDPEIGQQRRIGSTMDYYLAMDDAYIRLSKIYSNFLIIGCLENDEIQRESVLFSYLSEAMREYNNTNI